MNKDADPRGPAAFDPAAAIDGAATPAVVQPDRPDRKRIVVVGEFNSGKTALVNALVGAPVLAPSFVTHTAHPTVVGFAARPSLSAEIANRKRRPVTWAAIDAGAPGDDIRRLHVGAPLERLRGLSVVDTPGIGFADCESDQRSLHACRNADIVIWCTPAMQAWKASEEQAWLTLPDRVRGCGVLAVTFADAIASRTDVDRLMERLRAEAGPYFWQIALADACPALALATSERPARKPGRKGVASRSSVGVTSAGLR